MNENEKKITRICGRQLKAVIEWEIYSTKCLFTGKETTQTNDFTLHL